MSRPRILPNVKRKPLPKKSNEPSLSSFTRGNEDSEASSPYPQHFFSPGLRLLKTRQWGKALEFYREETRQKPFEADGWYGQAAAFLGLDKVSEAAPLLCKGYELNPQFPLGRLVTDITPDNPILWYNLSAVLVSERRRLAYMCAELILTECLGGDDDAVRGRAERVQRDIARMLEQRAMRDEVRSREEPAPWYRRLQHPAVGVVVAVLLVLAAWLTWRSMRAPQTKPPLSAPAASPRLVPMATTKMEAAR